MTHKRRRQGIGLGIFLFLALGLICGWMGVGGVEDTLTDRTQTALNGQGLTDIDVDYEGRKAILTGNAPAGTDKAALAALVVGEGVRDVDLSGVNVAAAAPVEVPTGTVDMAATVDGDEITLTGEVLNEGQRDELVSAAEAEFGAENVTDRLTVSGLAPEIDGADARVAGVAGLMPRLHNNMLSGKATLAGTALAVTGLAASSDAVDAVTGSATGLAGIDASVDLDFEAPAAPAPTAVPAPTATPVPEPTATPQPEPQAEQVIADLDLSGVQFEVGTAVLTADAQGILDNVALELSRFPDVDVTVEGHTDSDGGEDANLALSQARADSVVAYLVNAGINADRLTPAGFGETQPIADNDSDEGRALNRRVELVVEEGN